MKVLVLGGTRYFGIHMVRELIKNGHDVTIATRGHAKDNFADSVKRVIVERTSPESLKSALGNNTYDVICDDLAYCSNDVKVALDCLKCRRYVMISSTAVYNKHINTVENDFNPIAKRLEWCNREDYPYDEVKRLAECALFQKYKTQNAAAVRFPFVIGEDDYTKRLYFYVEHVINKKPMLIDNIDKQMSFIRSNEAGKFLAFMAEQDYRGAVNGSSSDTISINEMIKYVESKAKIKAVFSPFGDAAPYNGEVEYSINTELAKRLGFKFSPIKTWIYDLLDTYIELAESKD